MSQVRVAVCGLLHSAVRNSDYISENDSVIHKIDGKVGRI